MSEQAFSFMRAKNSDKPMGSRVYAGERCIGFVWRAWGDEGKPAWVTRLTMDGPDLSVEPSKHAAAQVLWRIAATMDQQIREAEAVPA